MTRILLVETASPKRICRKAEQILSAGAYPDPEIAILCRENHSRAFLKLSGVTVYCFTAEEKNHTLKELNQKRFDVVVAFWTGEKQYRGMKLLALRLKAKRILIVAGDTNEFHLTWKAMCRHAVFRWRHPLPSDYCDYLPTQEEEADYEGERILIIQSAEPIYVLKALERLKEKPPFRNPRYSIFCRNRLEVVGSFQGHPMLCQVFTHSAARGSWKHLRNLRRQRFDAVVLFMTGDPSYRKVKFFAFLLGVPLRHMLIFNKAIDCFFFNLDQWSALVLHRIRDHPQADTRLRPGNSTLILLSLAIRLVLLPFRFLWLLVVWLRLRFTGLRLSRKRHDYSLRLPLLPGS